MASLPSKSPQLAKILVKFLKWRRTYSIGLAKLLEPLLVLYAVLSKGSPLIVMLEVRIQESCIEEYLEAARKWYTCTDFF